MWFRSSLLFGCLACLGLFAACPGEPPPTSNDCQLVTTGFGATGSVPIKVEVVVRKLEVPWGVAFLPNGSLLITERPGRVRLVIDGSVENKPVATVNVSASGEGGLLGIALHPAFDFKSAPWFYLYYTADKNGKVINRVARYKLNEKGDAATEDKIIVDDIPSAQFHNGGRLRFGPDGMLYIGTGDARDPDLSQKRDNLAGKILRVAPDGTVPSDNPWPDSPVYITGIRNTQGFDWLTKQIMLVTDHGPSGDLGRRGHDEVNFATPGSNLGWPTIYRCEQAKDMITPVLTWQTAVPPGGAALYTGTAIPEWKGSLLIGSLGAKHLQRVILKEDGSQGIGGHEVYLQGDQPDGYGRLREVIMGPDQQLYVTTSNCDGRGTCPDDGDYLLRITK